MARTGRFANLELESRGSPAAAAAIPCPAAPGAGPQPIAERTADFFLQRARDHELRGDLEAAMRDLSAALGEDSLRLDAWVGQLWLLAELDETPEACVWADKALVRFPDNPLVLATKAVALHRLGRHQEAMDLNDAAIAGNDDHPLLWLSRGELLLRQSPTVAETCFQRALRDAQDGPVIGLRAASTCLRYRRPAWAMALLRLVLEQDASSAYAWHLLGLAQNQLGMTAAAAGSHGRAAELAPVSARYREAHRIAASPSLRDRLTALWRRLVH